MHNLPFDTVGLKATDVDTLEAIYDALKIKFKISLPDNIELDLNKFDILRCDLSKYPDVTQEVTLGGLIKIDHPADGYYIGFIKIHIFSNCYARSGEVIDYYNYQVWAFVNLKRNFGRVLIRHETFADKVIRLIHPTELQFKEDKAFNNKFYVVANDEATALLAMGADFRNAIMKVDDEDIVIEITGNQMIIGNNKCLDVDPTVYIAEAAGKIAAIR